MDIWQWCLLKCNATLRLITEIRAENNIVGSVCHVTSCVIKVEGNTSHKLSVCFCVCGNKLRYFSCHLNRGNKDKV